MTELLTSAQMRAIEKVAIASGAVTGLDLMERAGRGVVAAALGAWPELGIAAGRAVVLAGPGNNGGDGYVIARLLAERGWDVQVRALGAPDRLPPDARANRDRWDALGATRALTASGGGAPDLLVDAGFGTGLTRAIPPDLLGALHALRGPATRVVAVDCPSGLDTDTGALLLPEGGIAPRADLTVSFHRAKCGHWLGQGPSVCGELVLADIGLDDWTPAPADAFGLPAPGRLRLVGARGDWPAATLRPPHPGAHKYERGHVLVLAGGPGRGGAARMAAHAALRVGAGLVTLGCPPEALGENAARLDAVMLRALAGAGALAQMLEDRRLSALLLGPGLGLGAATRGMVAAALAAGRPTVLDADALSSFQDQPDALFSRLHARVVLTPHEGEFARLFPDLAQGARGAMPKPDAARAAADRAGCVVLLKGVDTVIASPGGRAALQASAYGRAAPWLGTAGAGDVLAGLIAGLIAAPSRGPVALMAEVAAWLHVEAARRIGAGLIAEDLPGAVPGVLRDLGL